MTIESSHATRINLFFSFSHTRPFCLVCVCGSHTLAPTDRPTDRTTRNSNNTREKSSSFAATSFSFFKLYNLPLRFPVDFLPSNYHCRHCHCHCCCHLKCNNNQGAFLFQIKMPRADDEEEQEQEAVVAGAKEGEALCASM